MFIPHAIDRSDTARTVSNTRARDVDVGARVLFPTRSIDPIPLAPSRIRARVTSTSGRAFYVYSPRDRSIRYRSHRLEYARA